MESKRAHLVVGERYNLVGHSEKNLLVLRKLDGDYYDVHSYRVRSDTTGWTMDVHGVNMYDDGSIDWDFSTNGFYTIMEGESCIS